MAISVTQAFKDALKGPIDRSQIKVEVYFSSGLGWVDISTYMLSMSGTMEEANFEGGSSANTLNLTLNNDDGRFSRKNTASPYYASGAGLVPNKPIKVSILVGSESVRIFTGYTSPWKTNALDRTCSVSAQDTARILVKQDVSAEETCFNATDPEFGHYLTKVIERAAKLAGLSWDAVTTLSSDWTLLDQDGNGSNEVTPTYTEANLLTANQQGIETDLTGITKSTAHASVTLSRVTTKHLRGAAALKAIKTVAGEQGGAYVNKTSGLLASTAYRGWAYLIADATTPSVPVDVWLRDESNAVTGTKVSAILTPNSWTRVPVTITTGSGACSDLRLYAETTGATPSLIFYADDFWMVKTAGTATATYTLAGNPVMTLDLVDLLMPVTSLRGKCLKLLSDLAQVVDGKIYFDAQGQLVFRAAMYRNDSTLASSETFTVSSLEDVVAEANFEGGNQFAEIVNRAVVESRPLSFNRDQDDALEAKEFPWNRFDKVLFGPGEVYPTAQDPDFILKVPDDSVLWITASPAAPTAADMEIYSSDSADLLNLLNGIGFYSGYPVFYPGSVKIKLQNNGSGSEVLTQIILSSYVMKRLEGCRSVKKNAASIALYNQRDRDISNDHIPNTAAVERLAGWVVENGRQVKDVLNLPVMYGCPWLEINDRVTASETITNTVPASEDFIVKRIDWTWLLSEFSYTVVACTLAADFTPGSSLPATVANVETRNINQNVVTKGELPLQAVNGTKGLVGLNNIPAFAEILSNIKSFPISVGGLTCAGSFGIVSDGSDIYVSDFAAIGPSRAVYQIDPMTGAASSAKALNGASAIPEEISIGGGILWAVDKGQQKIQAITIQGFSSNSWSVKSTPGGTTQPKRLIAANGKLYVIMRDSGTGYLYLWVWNSLTTALQDAADATYTIQGSVSTDSGKPVFDGRYLWIPNYTGGYIARFDTVSNTMSSTAITLNANETCSSVAHDGVSLWANILNTSGTPTSYLVRFYLTPSGMRRDSVEITLAAASGYVLFDGTYIWNTQGSNIYQISTTKNLIATYTSQTTTKLQLCFDGSAIWLSSIDGNVHRIPRQYSGRQF